MEKTVELRIKPHLDAVTIRPGDKLLVRMKSGATREQADEMRSALDERLPGVEMVIIAAEQLVVYRLDGDE